MTLPQKSCAALVVAILLVLFMPSSDSLWIDEGYNAQFAEAETIQDFSKIFFGFNRSENQMPLGMFASWIGGRVWGVTEYQLRAINITWGILGAASFFLIGRRLAIWWLPILFSAQPFVWNYMNEARPYALQLGATALLAAGLVSLVTSRSLGRGFPIAALVAGGFLLCASSLLGTIPFIIIAAVYGFWMVRLKLSPRFWEWIALSIFLLLLVVLAGFYIWTLLRHASGARNWQLGLGNITFTIYELFGFSGFGPSKQSLHDVGADGFAAIWQTLRSSIPALTGFGLVYLLAITYGCVLFARKKIGHTATFWTCAFVAAGAMLLIAGASWIQQFPFWARHVTPVLPFALVAFGILLSGSGRIANSLLAILIALLLISSVELRFADRHKKDDYRTASRLAAEALAKGKVVGWVADGTTGRYYGLCDDDLNPYSPNLKFSNWINPEECDMIVLGKPSVYDRDGKVTAIIRQQEMQCVQKLQGFSIYVKQ